MDTKTGGQRNIKVILGLMGAIFLLCCGCLTFASLLPSPTTPEAVAVVEIVTVEELDGILLIEIPAVPIALHVYQC